MPLLGDKGGSTIGKGDKIHQVSVIPQPPVQLHCHGRMGRVSLSSGIRRCADSERLRR